MKLKWTVELSVDSTWIADGFDLTDERALHMLQNDLEFAWPGELAAKVITYPAPEKIAKLQGGSTEDVLKKRLDETI